MNITSVVKLFALPSEKLPLLTLVTDENMEILQKDKKIIFFKSAPALLNYIKINKEIQLRDDVVCNRFWENIRTIQADNSLDNGSILETINFLDDCLLQTETSVAEHHKKTLYAFADYLTFNTNIDNYFINKSNEERQNVVEAMYIFLASTLANCIIK